MHDEKISDFLTRLADRIPAPGAGAVAALHVAQAAALLGKVARYTTGDTYVEHTSSIAHVITLTDELRVMALRLAQDDDAASTALTDAYELPQDTDDARATRSATIAAARVGAAQPPAEVIVVAAACVELAEKLLPIANPAVATDIAAAVESARAGATTARVHIEADLTGVKDEQALTELAAQAHRVDDLAVRADQVTAAVRKGITS